MNETFIALAEHTREPDWGVDAHSPLIPLPAWEKVWEIHQANLKEGWNPPFVSPCEDGLVHLSYRNADRTAFFRIEYAHAENQAYISYRNKAGVETTYSEGMVSMEEATNGLAKWREENK